MTSTVHQNNGISAAVVPPLLNGRPPKPTTTPTLPDDIDGVDASERTSCSRASFKEMVLKHASALTLAEKRFLHDLVVTGNEIEVQLAYQSLSNLFADLDTDYDNHQSSTMDDSETVGWSAHEVFRLGRERESMSVRSMGSSNHLLDESETSTSNWDTSCRTMGSERRQSILLERKRSSVFNLWKAHETGLAVSQQASRRSVLVRRNSAVGGGGHRRNPGGAAVMTAAALSTVDTIFRPSIHVGGGRGSQSSQQQQQLDQRRRVSWTSGAAMNQQRLRSSSAVFGSRPLLPRMRSEDSRSKSVTFSEEIPSERPPVPIGVPLKQRANSLPSIPVVRYERASSMGSIPSLHLGAPIGSPQSTVASIPSLRLAHAVRSYSARSDSCGSDITESERFYTNGDDDGGSLEEKKSSWEAASSSVDILERAGLRDPMVLDATKLLHANDPNSPLYLLDDSDGSKSIRPVLMRRASRNVYQGEGVEVTDVTGDAYCDADQLPSLMDIASTMRTSTSFDETMSSKRAVNSIFRRIIRRSLSDDSSGMFLGPPVNVSSRTLGHEMTDDSSWNLGLDDDDDYYDSWKVLEDEYVNGYGGGGTLPFRILGTSADDEDAHPHVLSPPLMESLLAFLPSSTSGDNFWMKYSMVRDGASIHSFLQSSRGARYSILAIETVEGEVFGAFTAEPWRKNWSFFGNGESFLWKMRKSRRQKNHSIIDQAQMESEIDVYPYSGVNNCIQLCTHDKIAVGGGTHELSSPSHKSRPSNASSIDSAYIDEDGDKFKDYDWGFGLTVEADFLHGTTSPCLTFNSPSLSTIHPSGSLFEIMNLELWTLTPCDRLEDAEKLELGKLFLEKHTKE